MPPLAPRGRFDHVGAPASFAIDRNSARLGIIGRVDNARRMKVVAGGLAAAVAVGAGTRATAPLVERRLNQISPRATTLAASPEARALHARLRVVDLHADTLLWERELLRRGDRGHVDLPRLRDGHVALQVFSSVTKTPRGLNLERNDDSSDLITALSIAQRQPRVTWKSLLQRSLHHAAKLERAVERSGGQLAFVRSRSDLLRILAARDAGSEPIGALFSVEGLHNLEGRLENVAALHDAGMRMAGLTHFFDNDVAGSMHGVDKGGLTGFGRDVMAALDDLRVVVDLAHASHRTVEEVLAVADRPVVISHGGVQATSPVNRNMTDDEIRGIAATGGVTGIGLRVLAGALPA